jgi:hypothetical protein
MGWPPRGSIERIDRMLVYGSSKPSSLSSIGAWLTPIASLAVRGRETRWEPADRPATRVRDIVGNPYFSGAMGSVQNLLAALERSLYVDHMRYIWSMTIRGLSVESVWRIGRVFLCRVFINSNHRNFRI